MSVKTGKVIVFAVAAVVGWVAQASFAQSPVEVKVDRATLVRQGKSAPAEVVKNIFAPGVDGTPLSGTPGIRAELRYPCKDVPEGDYYLGVPMVQPWGYFSIGEGLWGCMALYQNDTRVLWTSYTEPLRVEKAATGDYQSEMRVDKPVHVRPGDILRMVMLADGGGTTVGPLRLYKSKPAGAVAQPLDAGLWQAQDLLAQRSACRARHGRGEDHAELHVPESRRAAADVQPQGAGAGLPDGAADPRQR